MKFLPYPHYRYGAGGAVINLSNIEMIGGSSGLPRKADIAQEVGTSAFVPKATSKFRPQVSIVDDRKANCLRLP
jgi:hypothetical protein